MSWSWLYIWFSPPPTTTNCMGGWGSQLLVEEMAINNYWQVGITSTKRLDELDTKVKLTCKVLVFVYCKSIHQTLEERSLFLYKFFLQCVGESSQMIYTKLDLERNQRKQDFLKQILAINFLSTQDSNLFHTYMYKQQRVEYNNFCGMGVFIDVSCTHTNNPNQFVP